MFEQYDSPTGNEKLINICIIIMYIICIVINRLITIYRLILSVYIYSPFIKYNETIILPLNQYSTLFNYDTLKRCYNFHINRVRSMQTCFTNIQRMKTSSY